MARMKMLKILLPKRLPTARSTASILIAVKDTTNPGRDVETAIKDISDKGLSQTGRFRKARA